MDTERIPQRFPIRVAAYGGSAGNFSEETYTVEVNPGGARIALQHHVQPDDTIRIVNLGNLREADFRVVRQTDLAAEGLVNLDVECLDVDRNLWDIKFAPPPGAGKKPAGALLRCGDCGAQSLCELRDWESAILKSEPLQRFCEACGGPTPWRHADASSPALSVPPIDKPAAPVATVVEMSPAEWAIKRAHPRLPLKLPILVRDRKGGRQLSKTENVSKGGLAVSLKLDLAVGDVVQICCPYSEGGDNMLQKAVIRNRRSIFNEAGWVYGMSYVVPAS